MNASKSTLLRALRGLGHAGLLLIAIQACSGDDASTLQPPAGPASVQITGITLGQGFYGDGGASSVLACDRTIGVNVQTTNWTLYGPGRCGGALQCGQLSVSLLAGKDGPTLLTRKAASNGVALDVRSLLSASPPLQTGSFAIKVELVDDSGKPYLATEGGNGSDEQELNIEVRDDCPSSSGGAGTGGGNAGGGAATSGGSAGTSGTAGSAGTSGTAGSAGDDSAGDAGTGGAPSEAGAAGE